MSWSELLRINDKSIYKDFNAKADRKEILGNRHTLYLLIFDIRAKMTADYGGLFFAIRKNWPSGNDHPQCGRLGFPTIVPLKIKACVLQLSPGA